MVPSTQHETHNSQKKYFKIFSKKKKDKKLFLINGIKNLIKLKIFFFVIVSDHEVVEWIVTRN